MWRNDISVCWGFVNGLQRRAPAVEVYMQLASKAIMEAEGVVNMYP